VSQEDPPTTRLEAPVDPLYSQAASPFMRTEVPAAVAFPSPPSAQPGIQPLATLVTYKAQIQFALAILAYLMVLVGSVEVVQANPDAGWRFEVAVLPLIPAGIVVWLTVRALGRLDEVQKRTQMQALGFAVAGTALVTFGYGFLEGAGLPHLNWTFVLPLMALLWAMGLAVLNLKTRLRR
jgi:CDP-diglyceride synthetase